MSTTMQPGVLNLNGLITAVMDALGLDSSTKELTEDGKSGSFLAPVGKPIPIQSIKYVVAGYFSLNGLNDSLDYEKPNDIWGDVETTDGTEVMVIGFDQPGLVHFSINESH